MKSAAAPVVIAAILVGAGGLAWSAANRELRLAEAEREVVSLQFESAAATLAELSQPNPLLRVVPGADTRAVARLDATRQYWRAGYDQVRTGDDVPLLAANAAYRAVERDGASWQVAVGQFDDLVKRYADVLRNDPTNEDAAYNYEFVVRRRAAIAAA